MSKKVLAQRLHVRMSKKVLVQRLTVIRGRADNRAFNRLGTHHSPPRTRSRYWQQVSHRHAQAL
jgi:hypothetical protein